MMKVPTPSPSLVTPVGIAVSDSEKAEALAGNLEVQVQPVTDHSIPAVIEKVDVSLTTPDEVHEGIRGLKVSKAPGPNGIPNRALKYLPKRAVSLFARTFNTVLRTHNFPQTLKHARGISILKPGKDPALSASYRPISLLDMIGKSLEKILLARILHVVNERGLMRDEQFGFRPTHSTSLQLAHLVERITRNFDEKRIIGTVFLDVAKAFDTV